MESGVTLDLPQRGNLVSGGVMDSGAGQRQNGDVPGVGAGEARTLLTLDGRMVMVGRVH